LILSSFILFSSSFICFSILSSTSAWLMVPSNILLYYFNLIIISLNLRLLLQSKGSYYFLSLFLNFSFLETLDVFWDDTLTFYVWLSRDIVKVSSQFTLWEKVSPLLFFVDFLLILLIWRLVLNVYLFYPGVFCL
jgi:hypothetical protein